MNIEETLQSLNTRGASMALMEILASNVGDETKEQALRTLTNLGKNGKHLVYSFLY